MDEREGLGTPSFPNSTSTITHIETRTQILFNPKRYCNANHKHYPKLAPGPQPELLPKPT